MRNSDRRYLSKLALYPDQEFYDDENFNDVGFGYGGEIDQFMDEDIKDIEDLFCKD